MHNVIILIKYVFNENFNYCYYKVYFRKIYIYIYNIKMLYYSKIEVSEGIDVDKTSSSKECIILSLLIFCR